MPYGQERYLANHTMMSAIDKLHKLYSNEMEPIVWARSVGIEVLNELDSVKAAIMTIAGAQTGVGKAPARNFAWDFAGNAVQSFTATGKAVEILKGAVWNVVTSSIQNISTRKDGSGPK
jgi:ubiquinone biosynthesis monooxygenase Coq6